jgi:hypothetical protein
VIALHYHEDYSVAQVAAARDLPRPSCSHRRGRGARPRLTRNVRDNRLAETLRAYTIASQACRRAASP